MKKKYLATILTAAMIGLLCNGCNVNISTQGYDDTSVVEEASDDASLDTVAADEKSLTDSLAEDNYQGITRNKETITNSALEGKSGIELVEALNSIGPYPTEADFSEMYESIDDAIADCDLMIEEAKKLQEEYKGKLDNKETILAAFNDAFTYDGAYAKMLRLSEFSTLVVFKDLSDSDARKLDNIYSQAYTETNNILAFIDAEIYELPIEKRQEIFNSPEAACWGNYTHIYTNPDRKTFDEETSQIINTLEGNESAPEDTYNVLYLETPLPSITTPDGEEKELTDDVTNELIYGNYDHDFMVELDDLCGRKFEKLINSYTSLLQTTMQNNVNDALIHDYDNYLAYSLMDDCIEPEIYDKNIESVHNILPYFHKYVDLRKEVLGADDGITYIEMLDVVNSSDKIVEYNDAVHMVEEALLTYGDDYVKTFDDMLRKSHVDVYPAKNKRTGGFTVISDAPGTYSYIEMNYRGQTDDVRTIAHEGGHAMYGNIANSALNTNLCNTSHIDIFTHEIASTLNEYILLRHLIDEADNDEDKLYYLDSLITLINQTIILQTRFSEFEKYCYEKVESGEGLDAEDISDYWYNLEKEYEGESALVTEGRRYAWARIRHFHRGYYVYKYSTSATYSGIIANRIFSGDEEIVDKYLDMLALGAYKKPSDLLKTIDIDPTQDQVYSEFAELYEGLIDEYEDLLKATGRI